MIQKLINRHIQLFAKAPSIEEIKKSLNSKINSLQMKVDGLDGFDSQKIMLKDQEKAIQELNNLKNYTEEDFNGLIEKVFDNLNKEKEKLKGSFEEEGEEKPAAFIFEKEGQAKYFMNNQPLFYDRGDLWWLWNIEGKKWEIKDKVDILNGVKKNGVNTINTKDRTEILNALQQLGRESMPEELNKKCVQFKDKIINIQTGEETESTSKYFSTNPIPWKVGESTETPIMDKYFTEWVGEEYVKTLYQIIAYSCCSEQFMQRMIALVGGGSNGKGTFMKLLNKFIGEENCASSELALLSTNHFETAIIYKKLVCEMGEVSHDDLKNTNQIKKISGEDKLRFCFKGKTPFSDWSSTTCLINTNSLPTTNDKTVGFYRRWLIVDFPNQFSIKQGIIESIPKEEFENLAKKTIKLLKEMYSEQKFENEGNYKERMERYEERSNPVQRFIEVHCEEDMEGYVSLKKFTKKLNEYIELKHLRKMNVKEVKKILVQEGFEIQRTTKDYLREIYIINLRIIPNIPIIPKI